MADSSKKERKKSPIVVCVLGILALALIIFVVVRIISSGNPDTPDVSKFSLNAPYYNSNAVSADLDPEDLKALIEAKESFVVYVSLPLCTEETAAFREYVNEFQENNHISFFYMSSDQVKDTPIFETVKYFPSVILYHDGELVKYLDFNSDSDLPYYKSYDDFAKWFEKYVDLSR